MKSGACCLLRVACRLLFAVYWPLHVVRMLSVACLMSCRPLHVVCCMLHVVCCLLRICQCSREGCLLRQCCPLDRVCCTLSVAYLTLVTYRPLRVVTLHVAWPTSPVACCPLSVACSHPARRRFHVVSGPLPVPSCISSVACRRCRATPRRRTPSASLRRIAIGRLSGRRGPLQTEVGVRACVRACVREDVRACG
jgi:hypothetical protein